MSNFMLAALRRLPALLPALDDGKRQLAFGDLQRVVAQEQAWLRSLGVRRCALLAENDCRWVISDLALMACQALHVPLPAYFTPQQTRHALNDAGVDFVLTDRREQFRSGHPEFAFAGSSPRTGLSLLRREELAHATSIPAEITKITYTSGSTGDPKGVCLTTPAIAQVTRSLAAATAGLGVERHMCMLPLATLLENIAGVYVPLLLGAQVVVRPQSSIGMSYGGLDPQHLLRAVSESAAQSLLLVPELLRLMSDAAGHGWRPPPSLKFMAVGGACVSADLLDQARAAGLPAFEGYGLSECASVVCLNTPRANRRGSVGRPLAHARVRIDRDGQICVRGAAMSGYLHEPMHTDQEIRTGDLGEIDAAGFVYVRGRLKNMFITSMGRNVAPEWVESELTREPAIVQAMVSGEARPYAVAMIVPSAARPGQCVIEHAIQRANTRLPDYARVRRWRAFPEAPSLRNGLLTANGRLRREQAMRRHAPLIDQLYDSPEACADAV